MQVTSRQGQWLGDMAVREAGAIEAVVEMAIQNDVAITEIAPADLPIERPFPINRRVMHYYVANDIYPATWNEEQLEVGGIGSMAIEISFVVS